MWYTINKWYILFYLFLFILQMQFVDDIVCYMNLLIWKTVTFIFLSYIISLHYLLFKTKSLTELWEVIP